MINRNTNISTLDSSMTRFPGDHLVDLLTEFLSNACLVFKTKEMENSQRDLVSNMINCCEFIFACLSEGNSIIKWRSPQVSGSGGISL